ncbi:MAG: DinB family protein [Flavobacteriales bacterium]|nr:DinB family protein [Flavobacteriales bacterium]
MNSEKFPAYYRTYIDRIPEERNSFDLLAIGLKETIKSLAMVSEDKAGEAYAEGKWSIKEVLQHMIDTERIFAFRALAFARGEKNEILGYDHNTYAENSKANLRSLKSLLEELNNLRGVTIDLFRSFTSDMLQKEGNANGQNMSVEQIQYIIIGHELHHLRVIEQKYL